MSGVHSPRRPRQVCSNAGALQHGGAQPRSCQTLGACQASAQAASACQRVCRYPFAPGAVQGGPAGRRHRVSPLGRLVLQAMALLLLVALLGRLAGMAQARGWFL